MTTINSTAPSHLNYLTQVPANAQEATAARTPSAQVPRSPAEAIDAREATKLLDTRRSNISRSGFVDRAAAVASQLSLRSAAPSRPVGVVGEGSRVDDGGGALQPPKGVVGEGSRVDDGGGALQPPQSLIAPTARDLTAALRSLADAHRGSGAVSYRAPVPAGELAKYPSYDLSSPGERDRVRTAYIIEDRVFVSETGVTGLTRWSDVGVPPRF